MGADTLQKVEKLVVAEAAKGSSVSPDQLIKRVMQKDPSLNPGNIRSVLWHLVSQGRLQFNRSWNVHPTR